MVFFVVGIGGLIGISVSCSLVFFVVGWVVASYYFRKKIEQNPPISEELIRNIYSQFGKKLSETQVLRIMNNLKNSSR